MELRHFPESTPPDAPGGGARALLVESLGDNVPPEPWLYASKVVCSSLACRPNIAVGLQYMLVQIRLEQRSYHDSVLADGRHCRSRISFAPNQVLKADSLSTSKEKHGRWQATLATFKEK